MRLLHRDRSDRDDPTTIDERRTDAVRVAPTTDDTTQTRPVSDPEVVERPDRDDLAAPSTVRERTWTFAPGQLVSFAAGAATLAIGLIALLRTGVDASLAQPTVDVFGYSHTAWLALGEVGLGVLLLLAGSGAWGRPLSVLLGAATVVAGVLVLTVPGEMPAELGLEKAFGWPLIALGAVVALAAMTLPVWRRRTVTT